MTQAAKTRSAQDTRVELGTWQGRALIFVSAVLWSTSGFFAKAPWFDDWDADSRGCLLAFFRSLFALPVLLPLVKRFDLRPMMIVMTVCFAVMVWTFMSAMSRGPAATAIWLQYLCPAWIVLSNRWFAKQSIAFEDARMLRFSMSGVAFILVMELQRGANLTATLLGLLSGMAYAGVVTSMRSLRDSDPAWLITLNHLATVVILAPIAWISHQPITLVGYTALAFFGIFQMSIPYVLFAKGLGSVRGAEASMLTLVEPVLVPVWVYIAWHHHVSYQPPPWWIWVGGAMILAGLLQRYILNPRGKSNREA
ncbi:MAG: DMT family transporter [Planctomycetota bacterium]